MDRHEHTPQELAALELFHQLLNLSADDGDRSLLITLRLPNGRFVGDVWLSKRDVECLTDSALGMALLNGSEDAADPLPIDEREIAGIGDEVQAFLENGGQW